MTPGSFTDGTAKSTGSNKDYKKEANPASLTFTGTKGETHSFKVPTKEDAVLEAAETFTVGMSVSGTTLTDRITSTDTGTGTIDNDDSAEVTIADADADEGDDITFTVTLSEAVQGGLTVTPDFTDVTAVEGTDYDENTAALTFTGTKGETKTFTVSTTEDEVVEEAETFTVGLTASDAPAGTSVTDTDTGTGTINNDDGAVVTVNDASADEGGSITFTVTLGAAVQGGLKVTPDFTDVTAVEGTDYDENTAALTFTGTKGETKTFTVSTTEDEVLEADETFTVGLTVSDEPSGTTVTDTDTGTGTINNDDSAAVTIADAKADEGDDITFTVTLSEAVQDGLTVTPDFTDGTAAEGTDYDENTSALTFTGTKGETKSFTVSTTEDAVFEGNETFTVGLTASDAPTGTSVTDTDTGTGTIDNDDGAVVTVNDAAADEGGSMTFTVSLGTAVQDGLKVTPDFTDVTAAEGTDYDENTAALTFTGTKGETQTFTVSTTEDAVLEHDETFTVGLTVSGTPLPIEAKDTGTGTIDNDDSSEVTVNDASATEGDGITFTVTLSEAVQDGLTVTPGKYAETGTYPAESGDYTANTTGVSFTGTKGETQTFTVSTTEEATVEHPETFTVGLSVSNAPSGVTATDTGMGTIKDDDTATVSVSDGSATESSAITFTVTLSAAVQGGFKVTPGYTDGTAKKGIDYTPNTNEISFSGTANETKTFDVATIDDEVLEGNETFTVSLTVSDAPDRVTAAGSGSNSGVSAKRVAFASLTSQSGNGGLGMINNDDDASLSVTSVSAFEGDSLSFTVTLSAAVEDGLTATPGYTHGTTADNDYTKNTAALTFKGTKGETESFKVATIEDGVVESHETFTVDLAVSKAPAGVDAGTGTGTVYNDDQVPAVSLGGPADVQNGPFTVSIDFSKTVGGFQASDVSVSNGTASLSGWGSSYAAVITPSSSGTVTVSVPEGVAHDAARNPNSASGQYSVEADLVPPSVTLSGPADTQGGPFTVAIDFSEEVFGFEASDVTVGNGSAVLSGSDSSYTAQITPASSGTVTVDVAAGVAEDEAGNGNTASTAQYAVSADLVSPSVTLRGPAGPVAGSFTLAVTFSEPVSGFEVSDVTVGNGTATAFTGSGSGYSVEIAPSSNGRLTVDVAAGVAHDAAGHGNSAAVQYAVEVDLIPPSVTLRGPANLQGGSFMVDIEFSEPVSGFEVSDVTVGNGTATLSGSGSSYAAEITPASSGTVTVDVAAGVARDAAGHDNTAAEQYAVEADLIPPTVTLRGPANVQGGSFTVAISFSEPVSGFEVSDVTVGNGTAALSGSGSSYAAEITPASSGTVTVDVAAGVAHDAAGHGNSAAVQYAVEADLIPPTVTLRGPAEVQGGRFTVAISFSEPVSGFEVSDVTVDNGTAVLSGSGSSYAAEITPASSGTVTVDVAAGVARDAVGHGNTAAVKYSVQADLAAPSVSLSGPANVQGGRFTVAIDFSEPVSGFEVSDVTVGNGTAALSGSGSSYAAVITPASSGAVTVDVAAGAAHDAAGHGNTAAATYSIQADLVAPSVSLSGPADTRGGPFTVAIDFSEPVSGFEVSDVTVGNGTASLSGSGSSYAAEITPASSGAVTVDVAAGVARDAAGHGNSAAATYSVQADLVSPSVTVSGPAGPVAGSFDVSVAFSETVTGFEQSDLSAGNGSVTAFSGTGSRYAATIAPSSSGTVTVDVAAGAAVDARGHLNSAAVQYAVTADLDAPSVRLDGPQSVAGLQPFDVTATFSEAVTGFEQSDISVSNGAVTAFSGSGSSYTAAVTPSSSGTVTVAVAADAARDRVGRGNPGTMLLVQVVLPVSIQSVNQAPVFDGGSAQRSVAENTSSGQAIGAPVAATDPDGDALTYALAGTDAASFALDAFSGQLRTRAALDYEARTSYAVTVKATDPLGVTAVQAVTIAVTDENEPPAAPATPEVTAASLTSLTVSWTAPATPDRPAVSGYDVQYRIAGFGEAFTGAGHEGAATTLLLDGLKADTAYEVQVRAVNDEGAGPWSPSGTGRTLKNAAPVFASGSGNGPGLGSSVERTVAENRPAGEAVGAPVAATDADGDALTYALSGTDAASFDVDAASGQLRTRAALDYEARASYAVIVEATDPLGASAGQAVTIAVTDENEPPEAPEAPAVTAASSRSLSLSWPAPATPDRPAVSGYDVQYRIAGRGAAFSDAGHEGAGTTLLLSGLAADTEYEAQVRAVNDEGTGEWSASGTGRTDADPAPVAGDDAATVAEGGRVRIEVLANDSAFDGGSLSPSLVEEPLHGRVEVHDDGAVTYVHDGSETTADRFGYKADDGTALSETATVTLTVTPVNDPPVAEAGPGQEVDEGTAVTLSGSGTDPEGETLSFAWTQTGGPAVVLSEAASAAPSFTAPAQLAADTSLVFELVVTDASGAASAPDAVTVAVRADDDPPVFAGPYAFELEENRDGSSTPVSLGRVEATDPEGGAVTYALSGGGETPRFALDAASGELSYIGPGEDAEAVDEHLLTVDAADAGGLSASVEVTVAVLDVDEPGVVTLSTTEPVVGQAVSASVTDPDGEVVGETWQWRRSEDGVVWEDIPGATADRYTPVTADTGLMLRVTATYTDPSGAAPVSVSSEATAAVQFEASGLDRGRRLALAAVGRSVAEEVVETLQARMAARRTGAESHLTVNGRRTVIGEDGDGAAAAPGAAGIGHFAAGPGQGIQPPRVPGPQNPLSGSSFLLSMDDADQWTLWGREANTFFDGRPEADFGVDGRLLSGFLGLDYRRTGSTTGIGLTLAHNRGRVDYTEYTGAALDAGSADVTLTNLLPYLHWNPRTGLDLWSLGGYGLGTVDMSGLRSLNMRMAAAGARWDLRSLGRVDLAAKTDAFAVQLRPQDGSAADARRLRLALEGRTRWQDHDGDTWRPALELGLRWDGGDADRGAGAELAAELAYANVRHDFDLEARARRLLVHQGDGFRLWGASLVLRRESVNRRGLQLALGPNWGEGDSQVERLWQGDLQAADAYGAGPETSWHPDEMTLSSGYGLAVSRTGRLTPFVEAGAGHRPRLQVGARWEWNQGGTSQIEIYGEQRGAPGDETDRGIQIRGVFDQ